MTLYEKGPMNSKEEFSMLRREFAACQKMLTASIKVHVLHCGVRAGYWSRTASNRGAR